MNKKHIGRMQYFYHSPSSKLPIRDVLNEQGEGFKTEPHIEISAENFLNPCFQPNINLMKENDEKYLFLVTTCQRPEFEVYHKKSVVGFIEQGSFGINEINKYKFTHTIGLTKIVNFKDSILLTDLGYKNNIRNLIFDEERTNKILDELNNKENILEKCINEIIKLDIKNKTCYDGKIGFKCEYKNECARGILNA
ncbi:hypothetical protein K9L67_02070 [Candidatus Woesearchaeota archaeon]|nr:hypothetical protein [Candidatus Woesearchaeota archaeon]MCF7900990.1 hypothetical protein [Candidatus Woesearchaeota archaeon]MCF8013294.1 hypothetical protein [Candidatus Woesearchaeota archaeon]